MSNRCASPSPLAPTVRILLLSTNSSRLPSGEKLGASPAPTLCGTPPAVATTHDSLGSGPCRALLTLAGVSRSRAATFPNRSQSCVLPCDYSEFTIRCDDDWLGLRMPRRHG